MSMNLKVLASVFLLHFLAFSPTAFAQCVNKQTPSCAVYESCFAKFCPCGGDPDEYFVSYGKRYCEKFLDNAKFSPEGKKWRDSTLICLQESTVPLLDLSSKKPHCNCAAMRDFAFASHVACYTKPGASICALGAADAAEIFSVVQLKDLFSGDGLKQMGKVADICRTTAPEEAQRKIWGRIGDFIKKLPPSVESNPPQRLRFAP